jgi:hypothetical protein
VQTDVVSSRIHKHSDGLSTKTFCFVQIFLEILNLDGDGNVVWRDVLSGLENASEDLRAALRSFWELAW